MVPDGSSATGGLTPPGQANLRDWVAAGGSSSGCGEGTRVARAAGLTSTTEKTKPPDYPVIGSHFRVDVDHGSPVALGPARARTSSSTTTTRSSTRPPPASTCSPTRATTASGPTATREHADALKGTAALVDEPTGAGRAVLFAFNPLFRAYNESGLHLVANALLYPAGGPALRTLRERTVDARRRARARGAAPGAGAAADLGGGWRPIRLRSPGRRSRGARGRRPLHRAGGVERADGAAVIVIANPEGLQADEHPFARDLLRALRSEGVGLRSAVL